MSPLHVLLVSPLYRSRLGVTSPVLDPDVCVDIPPLSLATLAGLTPEGVRVDIWDECVDGPITDDTPLPRYDFVGVTGFSGHFDEALRVARVLRRRGLLVGVGGPGVSVYPEQYRGEFDILFIGEAEETWPAFLGDLALGRHRAEYRQITRPDISRTPPPDWSGFDLRRYGIGAVQTTRGCPFDCSFCDVIYIYGRQVRHRPVEAVLEEVRAFERTGRRVLFFSDDEFVGDRRYARELLGALIDLQKTFARPLSFLTQSTVNAARDPELLAQLADAGFASLFVGFETVLPESLKNIGKLHNLKGDLVDHAHTILSHGVGLRGNTIVGFDEDDAGCFDRLARFHIEACVPFSAVTVLMAPHGTPLWARLREEGRLVEQSAVGRARFDPEQGRYQFNLIPLLMSRVELMEGYRDLLRRLYAWPCVVQRMVGFIDLARRTPQLAEERFDADAFERWLGVAAARGLLDGEGPGAVRGIAHHCGEVAPWLWQRLQVSLSMQLSYRQFMLTQTIPALERQIAFEVQHGPPPAMKAGRPPVPRAFKAAFSELFPQVATRAGQQLRDGERLPEVLTTVFVDFLRRWGETFDAPEPHHLVFLAELTDRAVAAANSLSTAGDAAEGLDPRRLRSRALASEVLRNIDVELGFA